MEIGCDFWLISRFDLARKIKTNTRGERVD
jgi:hypothetical protein